MSEKSTLDRLDERKEPPARGVPLTLDRLVRPRKVYSGSPAFSSMPPRQNQYDSGLLAASMASTWRLRQQHAVKTSIPVNCPWGSARSCRVAPVHSRLPIAGPVLSLHTRAPLPSHVGPQQQDPPACSQESCHPSEPPWGSARSSCESPIHFRLHFAARFRVLSMCMCRARSCCCR